METDKILRWVEMQVYKAPLNDMKFLFKDFLYDGGFDIIFQNSDFEGYNYT